MGHGWPKSCCWIHDNFRRFLTASHSTTQPRQIEFAQVEVTTITYLSTRGNLTSPSSRIFFSPPYSIALYSLIISHFLRRSTWKSQNQKKMELERSSKALNPITGHLTFYRRSFILSSKKKTTLKIANSNKKRLLITSKFSFLTM